MNELLKGLIGAELTLLGVTGQVVPQDQAAGAAVADSGATDENKKDDGRPAVAFSQHDYRTAAG